MNKRVLSGIAGFWLLLSLCAWAQVNVKPMSMPKMQFFDANGNPLAGGFVYSYSAGTTTPLATYTDSTGVTPNANPVVLDSGGFASIWLGPSSYKFVVKKSDGTQVYSADNIPGNSISTGAQITSTVATGTAPLVIASTTPVANLAATPTSYAESGAQIPNAHIVRVSQVMGAGTVTFTLTGSAAFTAVNTYQCAFNDQTAKNPIQVVENSGNSITVNGTGSDVVTGICIGN